MNTVKSPDAPLSVVSETTIKPPLRQCNATVYHPDCFTRRKVVKVRCGRPAVVGSDFCGQHKKMSDKGISIERFE
jgi:hypothetical protein